MTLTSLPSRVLQFGVSSNHHDFYHETVAALSDHVDHLPVADLHHILAVYLAGTQSFASIKSGKKSVAIPVPVRERAQILL